MKRAIVTGLVAVLAVCGCQKAEKKEAVSVQSPEAKVFTAIMEAGFDGIETKTSLDNNGNVLWKMGDQVSIFVGSTINEQYQVTDASDGKTAAALNRVTSPGFVAGTDIDNNVAFYPYATTTGLAKNGSGYVISDITLPATQYYAEESFGNGAFPMAAVTTSTDDMHLKFKNVLGGLKLQLKGTARITSISIKGNNNEILCGAAEVTVANGSLPSISLTDATAKTVTLDCGNGVQLNTETATPFIIALPAMTMQGGFTVTVTDTNGGAMEIKTTKPQTITRSNLLKMPALTYEGTAPAPEHQYVDLGLPSGLKWATCNVGANSPEESGDYFAWGETEPYYSSQDPLTWKSGKTGYNWVSYKFELGTDYHGPFSKYVTNSSYGTVDNKTVLDTEDDAARANWGGSWRMPTEEEWTELRTECTWTWTSQNGAYGRLVTGPNGNRVFLPAAGNRDNTILYSTGSTGYYWSSSLNTDRPYNACFVYFTSYTVDRDGDYRYIGLSVRPVTDEGVRVSVTNVSLDNDSLNLTIDETATLTATVTPSNATQAAVIWTSSDTSVATVDYQGVVSSVGEGVATITATTYDGGFTATCSVTVTDVPPAPTTGTLNGYDWVDLGLTSGLKWATCNVGATAPEEYGDYFAWGETEPYYSSQDPLTWKDGKSAGYCWELYKFVLGTDYNGLFYKYVTNSSYGTVDNKTVLDPEDDAVRANWGGSWRMPTDEEWTELRTECTWTWTTQNGVNGRLVAGPNGNSIFLPAAGCRYRTSLDFAGTGLYWSSSLYTDNQGNAWGVYFYSDFVNRDSASDRCLGQSVRPVSE